MCRVKRSGVSGEGRLTAAGVWTGQMAVEEGGGNLGNSNDEKLWDAEKLRFLGDLAINLHAASAGHSHTYNCILWHGIALQSVVHVKLKLEQKCQLQSSAHILKLH